MESKLSKRAMSLKPSSIQELSHLAQRCNAINLAEGFPEFPAPSAIKDAAIAAITADCNQYRHVQGLCDYIAESLKANQGLEVDPVKNIAICCGQSEAFAAAILSVVNEGDDVLLLDPAYETYEACVLMAGGTPVYVALNPPQWTLDIEKLKAAFTSRTKAIVLNSPHNPTGKVFSRDELMVIAELCCSMDCLAVTDEVYEHITFDSAEHISVASLPGMLERTIITSSVSKTYSVTGTCMSVDEVKPLGTFKTKRWNSRRTVRLHASQLDEGKKEKSSHMLIKELIKELKRRRLEYSSFVLQLSGI